VGCGEAARSMESGERRTSRNMRGLCERKPSGFDAMKAAAAHDSGVGMSRLESFPPPSLS
jgi:hypothetical protein